MVEPFETVTRIFIRSVCIWGSHQKYRFMESAFRGYDDWLTGLYKQPLLRGKFTKKTCEIILKMSIISNNKIKGRGRRFPYL